MTCWTDHIRQEGRDICSSRPACSSGPAAEGQALGHCRLAFCASTGRTATMCLATTLNSLPGVVALHEGHAPGASPVPRLPLINLQNCKAWHEPAYAQLTVEKLRDSATLSKTAGDADMLIDVAFYNAPLLVPLARQHPGSILFVIFRRCEGFVRSATIVSGEDRQPAGWPDRSKPLTNREKFIALGRLRPRPGSEEAERWPVWSAIQRNIWLWSSVNSHLLGFAKSHPNCHKLLYEDLVENPNTFWTGFLRELGLFSELNLTRCMDSSAKKLNQRASYQVGRIDRWGYADLALYERLAIPLENEIYD